MSDPVKLPLDVAAIQKLLPHRFPFLLIDRVLEYEAGKRVLAHKNVSINEWFFQGHFPRHAVMPGVLVLEALAQAGGVLMQLTRGGSCEGGLSYLVKIDKARFSSMVEPGDRLELEVTIKREIRNMVLYAGIARVDGREVACTEILCAEVRG